MNDRAREIFLTALLLVFFAIFPITSHAQCSRTVAGLLVVGNVTGNPFQADVKVTLTSNGASRAEQEIQTQHVARDSQGRLRTDTIGGKFRVDNGAGAGTEEEQHHVTICDPVGGEWINLDTLNKVATVRKMDGPTLHMQSHVAKEEPGHFCYWQLRIGVNLNNSTVEDLGHRTIEGLDVQGSLERRPIQGTLQTADSVTQTSRTSTSEIWCSEELGAVVQRNMGTVEKGTTRTASLTNIQRGEPDPLLFQIPPGYRVVESVNSPGRGMPLGGTGVMTPVPHADSASEPAKP